MIPFSLHEIAPILNAKHIGVDNIIYTISINSNFIDKQCMFIALIGTRFDGHDFVEQAAIAGAQALLVNHHILLLNIPQLIVSDTRCALMKLASWIRRKVSTKVVAITGSSGKTSVKEMTTSILECCGQVIATKGNLNNTIGVPMTLLRLTKKSNFAIIELGTSRPGELFQLSQIVAADTALVNNIYPSHLSGFKSLDMIGKEKGEIFSGISLHGTGIINADNHALYLWYKALKDRIIWSFSLHKKLGIEFFASNISLYQDKIQFVLHTPCGSAPVSLSMLGKHNVANALAASALAFSMGATLSKIIFGLEHTITLPGRLFPIILGPGKLLLDDTYNSNVGSMIAAINVLNTMPGCRILVTSDMSELGKNKTIKYHRYIGKLISMTNINYTLTIGEISYFISAVCGKGKHFQNKNKLIIYLKKILSQNKLISILVKGSRNFKMEQIIDAIKDEVKCYFG